MLAARNEPLPPSYQSTINKPIILIVINAFKNTLKVDVYCILSKSHLRFTEGKTVRYRRITANHALIHAVLRGYRGIQQYPR